MSTFELRLEDLVPPGTTPLLLVILLGVVIALLFFSMRRHLRKIDVPVDEQHPDAAPFASPTRAGRQSPERSNQN